MTKKDWKPLCFDSLCEIHNPLSVEWTTEMVNSTLKDRPFSASTIASHHNAALAAEKAKIWREAPNQPDVQEAVIAKLDLVHRHAIDKAVSAEREKVQMLADAMIQIERIATDQQWFRVGIIATDTLAKVGK